MGLVPHFASNDVEIFNGDSRELWKEERPGPIDAIVTSPPYYGLRDYGHDAQLGLEADPWDYCNDLADLLDGYGRNWMEAHGSVWLNLGDTYSTGSKGPSKPGPNAIVKSSKYEGVQTRAGKGDVPAKSLMMIPERVAMCMIDRGWVLRNKVIWAKPNGMPSSVTDRLATKHEFFFHFVRETRYYYDLYSIKAPAKGEDGPALVNPGDWWVVATQPFADAHFAVYPPELIRRPIRATVPVRVCVTCGVPSERILERVGGPQGDHSKHVESKIIDAGAVPEWANTQRARSGDFSSRYKDEGYPEYVDRGLSDCGHDNWRPGRVLDPFFGSGTTGKVARDESRTAVGIELNPDFCDMAANRFKQQVLIA